MGTRWLLEDKYTVRCKFCGHEVIDTSKAPAQKYIIGICPMCKLEHNPKR
jgi:phage FluMu protein Com